MDTLDWEERKNQFRASLDADQVERAAVFDGTANVEVGLEDERMAGVVDDELDDTGNSWAERQCVLEGLSGEVNEEIQRRVEIMGDKYPFTVDGGTLDYQESATGAYELCLAASFNPTGAISPHYRISAVFEYLSRDVLRLFFGTDTHGFRTGWPPYEEEGRGTTTAHTFEALRGQCGEFRWDPRPDLPPEPDPSHLKDAGLDVVIWKTWPELRRRLGQFFALGQCACGKNDLQFKAASAREHLENWLRPLSDTPPLNCLLAAHHLPNETHLRVTLSKAGLVFDRARIVMLAESAPEFIRNAAPVNYHEMARQYASPT